LSNTNDNSKWVHELTCLVFQELQEMNDKSWNKIDTILTKTPKKVATAPMVKVFFLNKKMRTRSEILLDTFRKPCRKFEAWLRWEWKKRRWSLEWLRNWKWTLLQGSLSLKRVSRHFEDNKSSNSNGKINSRKKNIEIYALDVDKHSDTHINEATEIERRFFEPMSPVNSIIISTSTRNTSISSFRKTHFVWFFCFREFPRWETSTIRLSWRVSTPCRIILSRLLLFFFFNWDIILIFDLSFNSSTIFILKNG